MITGMGEAAASAGMGLLLGGYNDRRQYKQQEKLQGLQIKGQKEMADYNSNLAFDMWNKTNYGAQRKHLEDAGLSAALFYGGSGAGGATTNAGGGGNVTGGVAPSGGGEVGMALERSMMGAQLELIKAQTAKTEAEAVKTAGVDTELAGANIKKQIQDALETQLSNEYMSKGAYEKGMTGYEVKYQQEAARVYNTMADTAIKKLNLEQMPVQLQNEVKRVTLEGQRVAIDAMNARTNQDRNAIYERVEALKRSLALTMQGNQMYIESEKLNQQNRQFSETMEQKDEDQMANWIDKVMSAAIPWYEPGHSTQSHSTESGYNERDGHYERSRSTTTTNRRN